MTTATTLDVINFPTSRLYGPDGKQVDLGQLINRMRPTIETLADPASPLIRSNPSFGFAMANPKYCQEPTYNQIWDNPEELGWLVGGWGPDCYRYIANAIRKMRAAAREQQDTLTMRIDGGNFQDVVESRQENGTFLWGDFPWGGAVWHDVGIGYLLGAVSCLQEVEDHAVASLILGLIGKEMILADGLLSD